MNKILKVILNILIVIAAIAFLINIVLLVQSFKYANREVEDPAETFAGVFEYELQHRAYGEIMSHYYAHRLSSFDAPEGYEDLYRVAGYAHAAFMSRVYSEKGDEMGIRRCNSTMSEIKAELGDHAYTADVIDEMIRNAP